MAKEQFKWDVPIGRKIEFFDPELTYELSKYRPITETKGLDFDKTPFIEAGVKKDATGKYTNYPIGTKSHRDWWVEQMRRCKEGFEHNGYRITGDHYFFLNFYVLQKLGNVTKAGSGRDVGHPDFWSKHYEYFHYIDICEHLGKDVIAFKARGVGFSEMAVCLGVRPYITNKKYKVFYVAFSDGLLTPTLSKCWDQLEYLNQETETAFSRLRQVKDTTMWKKASYLDSQKNEKGFLSEIMGVVADNSRKLRGSRVDRLIYEESGSNPILTETYVKGQALVDLLGRKIGTRIVFGTGGDSGPALAGLEKMFINPAMFEGLPYRHNHTTDGQYALTGFFLPAYSCFIGYKDEETGEMVSCMDHRGVTNSQMAKDYYNAKRRKLAHDPVELMNYCAEYCFYPEEALSKQGQNDFNQALLAQQYTEIKILKSTPVPERGHLFWTYKEGTDEVTGVRWEPNPKGMIMISEHPVHQQNENGSIVPVRNLYCSGTDSIDHGEGDSVVGAKGSKFCMTIKKRRFGNTGNKYVAYYMDRPMDVREAYTNGAKLLMYYSCKTNLEDTKIGFRTWLRLKKLDRKYLMERPSFALGDKRPAATLWGTPGSEKMIMHGLSLVTDFVEDGAQSIFFIEMIEQLQKFSYEAKGLFDIVMSMVYCEIADEDMYDLVIRKTDDLASKWKDVGYFTDANGKKQFGVRDESNKLAQALFPNHPYMIQ